MGIVFWPHPNKDIRVFKKSDDSSVRFGPAVAFTTVRSSRNQVAAHYLVKRDRDYTLEVPVAVYSRLQFKCNPSPGVFANFVIKDLCDNGNARRINCGPTDTSAATGTFDGYCHMFLIHFYGRLAPNHADYTLEVKGETETPIKPFNTELVFRVLARYW